MFCVYNYSLFREWTFSPPSRFLYSKPSPSTLHSSSCYHVDLSTSLLFTPHRSRPTSRVRLSCTLSIHLSESLVVYKIFPSRAFNLPKNTSVCQSSRGPDKVDLSLSLLGVFTAWSTTIPAFLQPHTIQLVLLYDSHSCLGLSLAGHYLHRLTGTKDGCVCRHSSSRTGSV